VGDCGGTIPSRSCTKQEQSRAILCLHGGACFNQKALSMMAPRATAEGGDRFAVVIDKALWVKKIAGMRTMDQSQRRLRVAVRVDLNSLSSYPTSRSLLASNRHAFDMSSASVTA
jgi:hypothetical protein